MATITLDEVAQAEQLPRVDFIKLDVEGAEELVLRGAEQVLEQWRPMVLFEVNAEASQRLKLAADGACQVLRQHGYQLLSLDDAAGTAPDQFVARTVSATCWQFRRNTSEREQI